jgi:rhodanese-related sulfurtransferase
VVAVTPAEVRLAIADGAAVVDTRPLSAFTAAHLPGALPLEFNLADLTERAELLLPKGLTLVVHAEPERTVAASVGLLEDAGCTVLGHLDGGLQAWQTAGGATAPLPMVDVDHLHTELARYRVLDVREPYEFRHGHIVGAQLLPSGEAWVRPTPQNGTLPIAVFCSGYGRAAFVAAVLARRGVPAVLVAGGMYEWTQHGHPVVSGAE